MLIFKAEDSEILNPCLFKKDCNMILENNEETNNLYTLL